MKRTIRRVMSMGCHVVVVLAIGGCQIQAGTPCGGGLCPEGMICKTPTDTELLGTQERCVIPNKCGNGVLEPDIGEVCDDGEKNGVSSSCRTDCRPNSCGDGRVDPPDEECDDGLNNNDNGKHCRMDCIINRCGDGFVDADREQCDGAPQAAMHSRDAAPVETRDCNLDCTTRICGDGKVNQAAGEDCDDGEDGIPKKTDRCNLDCTLARCGDGKVNDQFKPDGVHPEFCDEIDLTTGASLNGVPCDYGKPFCPRCNATCTGPINPGGPFCGDGIRQTDHEQCDPATGPAPTLSDAPVVANADSADCDFDCTSPICGDGHLNTAAGETCDDRNQRACGTCPSITDTDCRGAAPITPIQAHSTVQTSDANPTQIETGDRFTLDDGFGGSITFEFVKEGDTLMNANDIPISFRQSPTADGAETIASNMAFVINSQAGFGITASVPMDQTDNVVLTNRRRSVFGNTTITVIGLPEFRFGLNGTPNTMAGGLAGDCGATIGCVSADDCETGVCSGGTCQTCTVDNQCPESTICNMSTGKCH